MTGTVPDKLDTPSILLFLSWLLVTLSVLGSLFFSEVMEYAPCSLCWWQRIFMFPLLVVLSFGLFPFDGKVVRYALPLAVGGWLVALYHTLLYSGVIPESAAPCTQGVSCTEVYIELFGFLSIPLLSLLGFTAITTLLVVLRRRLTP